MFKYILRFHLLPTIDFAQRVNALADFCKKADIDEIMFFIGAEDTNTGHITINEAKSYIDTIMKAQERLKGLNLSYSLNPWMTIGHYDGGKGLKEGQHFTTMVGYDGLKAKLVACPMDEEWREYYTELINYYVKELQPTTIWLEDDFRLRNHRITDRVIKQGCFCDEHMKRYSQKLGKKVEREEFVNSLSYDLAARKAFLDLSRETMEETIGYIARNVDEGVRFGLMTSEPAFEEGRRMDELFKTLGANGREKPMNRITLAAFRQAAEQTYAWNINRISMLSRSLTGDTAECVSELENYPHNIRTKSVNFNRYQMLSAVPLCFSGVTFSIFEFCGNGAIHYDKLAKAFHDIKPYLSKVEGLKLLPSNMVGVRILVNKDSAYNMRINGSNYFDNNADNCGYICSVLSALGIACTYTTDQNIKNEVVAVSGQTLRALEKQEIIDLFNENFVLLTADNVVALFDVGLNHLINAESYEVLKERDSVCSIEEVCTGEEVCGISQLRATCNFGVGDYIKISYLKDNVKPFSKNLSHFEKEIGFGITQANNALIIPYFDMKDIPYAMFNILREYCIKKAIFENAVCAEELFFIDEEGVIPYVFKKDDTYYVQCVNYSDDKYSEIHLRTKARFNSIKAITVEAPIENTVHFERLDNTYLVRVELNLKESMVLRFE